METSSLKGWGEPRLYWGWGWGVILGRDWGISLNRYYLLTRMNTFFLQSAAENLRLISLLWKKWRLTAMKMQQKQLKLQTIQWIEERLQPCFSFLILPNTYGGWTIILSLYLEVLDHWSLLIMLLLFSKSHNTSIVGFTLFGPKTGMGCEKLCWISIKLENFVYHGWSIENFTI